MVEMLAESPRPSISEPPAGERTEIDIETMDDTGEVGVSSTLIQMEILLVERLRGVEERLRKAFEDVKGSRGTVKGAAKAGGTLKMEARGKAAATTASSALPAKAKSLQRQIGKEKSRKGDWGSAAPSPPPPRR